MQINAIRRMSNMLLSWRCSPFVIMICLSCNCVHSIAATIPNVEVQTPVVFTSEQQGRPVFLKTVKTRFEAPGVIGESQAGWFCSRQSDIVWSKKSYDTLVPIGALGTQLRFELEAAGYPVPKRSDSVFEEKKDAGSEKSANNDLQLGIYIKEIAFNVCSKGNGEWTGALYLKLNWQLFAPETQKVIFESSTEGSFATKTETIKGALNNFTLKAFAVATKNLLANPGFLKAVTTPMGPEALITSNLATASGANSDRLQIEGASATQEPLTQKITQIRTGVATIFGDVGSGTGFFVGNNGLLLTNQHVVGKTKFVKVRLTTGRELVGEVLRSDVGRDVALIKTESIGVPPLAVRVADAVIGEDVFAIGSPLGDSFNSTLTKGILSGVRELTNQPFLQSDVAILPGNSGGPLLDGSGQVIGITVMGLGAKGLAGMNFFIPIGDALNKLGVQVSAKK